MKAVNAANSPAISILLASYPRFYLRYCLLYIRSMHKAAIERLQYADTPDREVWHSLAKLCAQYPLLQIEVMLREIDHHVYLGYTEAKLNDEQRAAAEKQLLITGDIPEVLMPVVKRLLTTTKEKLFDGGQFDLKDLYFQDFRALNLTDDESTKQLQSTVKIDVLRKVPLKKNLTSWRRCTRCGSCMGNLAMRGEPTWITTLQKSCVCGNAWMIETAS